ncbi:MAG: hemolysin family protein [Thermodesulfobacteriaceae bacterium]|nr:hemolysin family protein [Thermodesulfobacteriaceae bacterium]MCX8042183.1 hemolysin family protein [Thermodesulfobacteriaceae bacterium]
MLLALLSFIFFTLGEAFFSLSEITFISTGKTLIENLYPKNVLARLCLKFLENPEKLFTTTILGITLCIAGNGIFTSYFLIQSLQTKGILISSTILPISMIFFGQILPKSLGKKVAFPLVLYLAPFLYFFSLLFYPAVFINSKLSSLILKKKNSENPFLISKFREAFLNFISYEEEIDHKEKELMHKIVEFVKKRVSQVMIPAPQIKALPIEALVQDALEFSQKYNFSYIPLYEGDITKIKLIVKVQDLLGKTFLERKKPLKSFGKKPFFIPEMALAHQVLNEFQTQGIEIGIVVDEYGYTTGLVTIEDLIEEVLGEFRDALDYYIPEYKQISKDTFLFKGHTEIEKVQALGIPIPSGEYETIGGFILSLIGRIPSEGEVFHYKNLEIKITKASLTKIEEILVKIKR